MVCSSLYVPNGHLRKKKLTVATYLNTCPPPMYIITRWPKSQSCTDGASTFDPTDDFTSSAI